MQDPLKVESTIQDLADRWKRAREAAYFKVFNQRTIEAGYILGLNGLEKEKFDDFLKLIFLNSRNLGRGYQKAHEITWEKKDFSSFAEQLGSSCLVGTWEVKKTAEVLNRPGCKVGKSIGRKYCQYWREAIDGLVAGISDEVGFVRSSSVSVDDESCVDVFYDDESSPTDAIWSNPYKWGALPEEIKGDLELIQQKFIEMKVSLSFLGLSEKNLFYRLEPQENLTCGSAGEIYRTHLAKLVKEKFPSYSLKDASPVAVYGERA